MSAAALLAHVRLLGIELETDGARLRWRPRDAVGPALRAALLAHREELIAVLTSRSGPSSPDLQPVYALLPGGRVEKVGSLAGLPPEAIYFCWAGSKAWIPVATREEADPCCK